MSTDTLEEAQERPCKNCGSITTNQPFLDRVLCDSCITEVTQFLEEVSCVPSASEQSLVAISSI